MADHDWAGFCRTWREDAHAVGWKTATGWAFKFGLAQFLPEPLVIQRRKLLDWVRSRQSQGESALAPELAILLEHRREAANQIMPSEPPFMARRAVSRWLANPYIRITRDRFSQLSAQDGVEPRSPMYARSFIEFALATPKRVKSRAGSAKHLHRMALRDLLPEAVMGRKTKCLTRN